MKKSLFAILAIAACFASCSKVVEHSPEVNQVISFDNYVGKDAMTKAAVTTGVQSVNVNAFLHPATTQNGAGFQSNFMTNQAVTYDETKEEWVYTPSKFWPAADQKVDFVAWVPQPTNVTVSGATLNLTVPTEVNNQVDLLVANPMLDENRAGENSPINLSFKHLLSRIGFEIVATGIPTDNVNVVTLEEVSLNGSFANYGTVDMTHIVKNESGVITETPFVQAASVPSTVPTNGAETATTNKYTLTGTHFGWDDNKIVNATKDTENTLKGVSNLPGSYIMLIPDGNNPSHITVTYKVTTTNGEDAAPTVITNTANFSLQPQGAATPFKYEAGKAYKYIFNITMQSITFSVEEDTWDEEIVDDIENNYTPAPVTPNTQE